MTGLYTRDGRRVIVNKDKSDEEDDVSSIIMLELNQYILISYITKHAFIVFNRR